MGKNAVPLRLGVMCTRCARIYLYESQPEVSQMRLQPMGRPADAGSRHQENRIRLSGRLGEAASRDPLEGYRLRRRGTSEGGRLRVIGSCPLCGNYGPCG